jgi:hypothetical protein
MKHETADSIITVGGCAIGILGMVLGTYWGFDWGWRLAKGQTGLSWWIVFVAVWALLGPIIAWAVMMALSTILGIVMAAIGPKET